jgi:hypothetical protein
LYLIPSFLNSFAVVALNCPVKILLPYLILPDFIALIMALLSRSLKKILLFSLIDLIKGANKISYNITSICASNSSISSGLSFIGW